MPEIRICNIKAVQQNKALSGKNNPNATYTYKSVK